MRRCHPLFTPVLCPWKEWTYATGNGQAGFWSRGKLQRATRHNYVLLPGNAEQPGLADEIHVPVHEEYVYDGVGGRISRLVTTIGTGEPEDNTQPVFTYGLGYDPLGNVTSRSHPECSHLYCVDANEPRTVSSAFTQGLLTEVPGFASALDYHPNGTLRQVTHGNGVLELQEKDPDDMARPARLRTSGASEDFDTGRFGYDGAGNVTTMGLNRMVYDVLSRVTDAEVAVLPDPCTEDEHLQSLTVSSTATVETCGEIRVGPAVQVTSTGSLTLRSGDRVVLADGFQVDAGGGLAVSIDPGIEPEGGGGEATWEGGYELFGNLVSITTQRPGASAVTRTPLADTATNRLSVGATYDAAGNLTAVQGWRYRYGPFGLLREADATLGTEHYTFVYGPGDERIWTIDWTDDPAFSAWDNLFTLRDLDGRPLRQYRLDGENTEAGGTWTLERDFVWRGGALLAAVTGSATQHFHLDHLGTPRLVTDATGSTLTYHGYFPFGEEATTPTDSTTPLAYTAHERDDTEQGRATRGDLDYMHARYFSAHLGRFHSVDPVGGAPTWPQSWNRYSYVLGNPMKYTDPRGLIWEVFQQVADYIPFDEIPIASFDAGIVVTSSYDYLPGIASFPSRGPRTGSAGGSGGLPGLNTGGPDPFELNLYERFVSGLDIDGLEFGRCIERNRFDLGKALTAFDVANPVANKLVGSTGRMGFGGLGPHPTTWQHKLGGRLSRVSRNPVFGRVGKLAGRVAIYPTLIEGGYDIGVIAACTVTHGGR